jgi:hypothetical protein
VFVNDLSGLDYFFSSLNFGNFGGHNQSCSALGLLSASPGGPQIPQVFSCAHLNIML